MNGTCPVEWSAGTIHAQFWYCDLDAGHAGEHLALTMTGAVMDRHPNTPGSRPPFAGDRASSGRLVSPAAGLTPSRARVGSGSGPAAGSVQSKIPASAAPTTTTSTKVPVRFSNERRKTVLPYDLEEDLRAPVGGIDPTTGEIFGSGESSN